MLFLIALAGWPSTICPAEVQYKPVDPYAASVRLVRSAIVPQQNDAHLELLASLRSLRDPTLKPLFESLATERDAAVQAHAALGLAVLASPPAIEAQEIRNLISPAARLIVLRNAMQAELLSAGQLQQLLVWDQLEAVPAVLVALKLFEMKQPIDSTVLARLTGHADIDIAGIAARLLAELGQPASLDAYVQRLDALSSSSRAEHLRVMLSTIGEHRLASANTWVNQLLAKPIADEDIHRLAVLTLLRLDPHAALPHVQSLLRRDPSQSATLHCALMMLLDDPPAPRAVFELFPTDDPLIALLVRIGQIHADGSDVSRAMMDLIDLDHPRSSRTILSVAKNIPPDQAAAVYLHVIQRVEGNSRDQAVRIDLAVTAARALLELDRAALERRLIAAEDDSLTQEVILIGLLGSDLADAGTLARSVKRMGYSRADSLALLLVARDAKSLSKDEIDALSRLAKGGGRLSEPLTTQAAWLYLKHSGQLDRALQELLADR